jgi:uncharacterized integral membrane protein (TIGR00698 family)
MTNPSSPLEPTSEPASVDSLGSPAEPASLTAGQAPEPERTSESSALIGWREVPREWPRLVPGLVFAAALAVVASILAAASPVTIAAAPLGMILGLGVAALPLPLDSARPGIRFASSRLLRVGVALLGVKVSVQAVVALGLVTLFLIVATMAVAFGLTRAAAGRLGVPRRLGLLLGVGNAVCGNTAIAATGPIIQAEPRETAAAVAVVTIYGLSAVILFPIIGAWIAIPPVAFGIWCGVAVNDTSQVVAAASAGGPIALQTATVIKFVRNAMLAPVLIGINWAWRRTRPRSVRDALALLRVSTPPFVLGFLALVVLNSVGLVPARLADVAGQISTWLILIALVAVGLGTDVRAVGRLGIRPAIAGIGTAALVAVVTLVVLMGPGRTV